MYLIKLIIVICIVGFLFCFVLVVVGEAGIFI